MSAIFSPLDAATPASLTMAGPTVGTWPAVRHVPSVTPAVTTPGVNVVQPPQNIVATTSTTTPLHTLTTTTTSAPASDTNASLSQTSLLSRSSTESSSSSQQQPQSLIHASHTHPQPGLPPVGSTVPRDSVPHPPLQTHVPAQLLTATAPLPDANVFLQHLEKRICDSIDEQRYFRNDVDVMLHFILFVSQIWYT